MSNENHFLKPESLLRTVNKKMDYDVIKSTQGFVEKILNDIINRSALISRHCDSEVITSSEISIIIEKDFDYTFGLRSILPNTNPPTNEHIESMAELSRQK